MQKPDCGTFYTINNNLVSQANECVEKGVKGAPKGEKRIKFNTWSLNSLLEQTNCISLRQSGKFKY